MLLYHNLRNKNTVSLPFNFEARFRIINKKLGILVVQFVSKFFSKGYEIPISPLFFFFYPFFLVLDPYLASFNSTDPYNVLLEYIHFSLFQYIRNRNNIKSSQSENGNRIPDQAMNGNTSKNESRSGHPTKQGLERRIRKTQKILPNQTILLIWISKHL